MESEIKVCEEGFYLGLISKRMESQEETSHWEERHWNRSYKWLAARWKWINDMPCMWRNQEYNELQARKTMGKEEKKTCIIPN